MDKVKKKPVVGVVDSRYQPTEEASVEIMAQLKCESRKQASSCSLSAASRPRRLTPPPAGRDDGH